MSESKQHASEATIHVPSATARASSNWTAKISVLLGKVPFVAANVVNNGANTCLYNVT
jgi:hypothetical protein